jgi:hypothetical protein
MAMVKTRQNGSSKTTLLTLDGKLSIARAREIREIIAKALREGERVVVEFGECTTVDLSFLQLLCSAHREALGADRSLQLGEALPRLLSETAEAAGYYRDKGCAFDRNYSCLWLRRQSMPADRGPRPEVGRAVREVDRV